jgi:hypothetical protein
LPGLIGFSANDDSSQRKKAQQNDNNEARAAKHGSFPLSNFSVSGHYYGIARRRQ